MDDVPKIPHIARRPMFLKQGTYTEQSPILHRTMVYERGDELICSGYGALKQNITPALPPSFQEILQASLQDEAWCFDLVEISGDPSSIAKPYSMDMPLHLAMAPIKKDMGQQHM